MRVLADLCIVLLAATLVSCGCGGKGSRKTKGLTLAELQAKLDSLKKSHEAECDACAGKGRVMDDDRGIQVVCRTCKGTGKIQTQRGPTTEEFMELVGEPIKTEDRDLIWEYWYYKVKEGTVRIHAYYVEERDDVERVVTGKVELLK